MKIFSFFPAAAVASFLALPTLWSETVVDSGPLSGVIEEVVPSERLVLKLGEASPPRSFVLRKTTKFVDAQGNVVAMEKIRRGGPVSVQYIREGNDYVVEKVIVSDPVAVPPGPASATTTTAPQATTTTTATSTTTATATSTTAAQAAEPMEGMITEFVPASELLVIDSPQSSVPVKYRVNQSTEFVDLEGGAVERAAVALGRTVRVHYVTAGPDLVATRVVVGEAQKLVPVKETTTTVVTPEN